MRVFPGPIPGDDRVACPWIPDASLANDGRVAPEFLWAALDCPGGFAFPAPDGASVLLGELRARLLGEVAVGERCTLVSRQLAHERRKHTTATSLYGEDGTCRGQSVGIWIEVAA